MIKSIRNKTFAASGAMYYWLATGPAAYAGIFGNVPSETELGGGPSGDARTIVLKVTKQVLSFMALIAVVVIVIAGIRLVVSQGEQEATEKGKKTILWAIVGLIVILLARAIVDFLATTVANNG